MQSGIHPDWGLEDYERWLRVARDEAAAPGPTSTCTPTRRWRSPTCATSPGCRRTRSSRGCADAGLGSTPGTAAEVLHDGVRERISPNKLPVARWVEVIEASHRAGLRSTATVMFGHVEEPWELAVHLRVVRELQERTGGITEFVPLSFIPFQTLLGRTHGVEEITREENLKHTAVFRLALGRSIPSLQASWVKMGLEAATEALPGASTTWGGRSWRSPSAAWPAATTGCASTRPSSSQPPTAAGRDAAERTTLYDLRRRWPAGAGTAAA